MEFRILGPLQVLDGEAEVPLGSPKERELLAVLLLRAGAVVSRERLIDALWGESPPATAGKALNVHVSQLRKTLARNGHNAIATRAPGYALEVEPERLDAARFDRLVLEARGRVAAGDVESARALLRDALALWRGPALDGVELEAAARNDVARLEELRLAAQMDRIDCELALGLHEQLIGELEVLVAEYPLRERLRGQLMLALYRAGRQADALRCYREARETLVGELGIEPSVPLQRLERAILNQDQSLEVPTGLAHAGTAMATELPVPPTPLIGRERELAELRRLLQNRVGIVTVVGPGGVGKTRLALELARQSSPNAVFVDLAPLQDPEQVLPAVAQALGVREAGERPLAEAIIARVRALGECLLLLDTCEHVAHAAPALAALVAPLPKLQLLATSRAALRVAAEREYRVEPLPEEDAVALFVERARRIDAAVAPDEAVVEICRRLDGLPLAIELAAARVNVLTPPQILERLARRLELLTARTRDAPPRQQTLRAAIDWSHALLDDTEKRLFAQIAVFAGGFTLESAEAVCGATVDALAGLVDKNLVRRDGDRFAMLDTIRDFARERLDDAETGDQVREAHADYFLAKARTGSAAHDDRRQRDQLVSIMTSFEGDYPNLREALLWFRNSGERERLLELVEALVFIWWTRSLVQEGRQWLEEALRDSGDTAPELRSRALRGACALARLAGDYDSAMKYAQQRLAIADDIGSAELRAWGLVELGVVHLARGDLEAAATVLEEGRALAREGGDWRTEWRALLNLGGVALYSGDYARSEAATRAALDLSRGDRSGATAEALRLLASVTRRTDRRDEALQLLRESLTLDAQLGSIHGVSRALDELAVLLASEGRRCDAIAIAAAAKAAHEESGSVSTPLETQFEARERADSPMGEPGGTEEHPWDRSFNLDQVVDYALDALERARSSVASRRRTRRGHELCGGR